MEFRLLTADEIDVKVKQVTEKGALALLYKTARTDMAILDETFGVMNWTDDYKEIKGNLYCGIGVRESQDKPFIWKWDCGIESREDEEGNQKKGEASDAFKRAGTKLGIGRELYTSPFIFLKVETISDGKKWQLKNKFQTFSVKEIDYDDKRNICKLVIVNDNNDIVYTYGNKPKNKPTSPKQEKVEQVAEKEDKTEEQTHLTFEEACEIEVNLKDGWKKLKDVESETLELIIKHAKVKEWKEGAKLILEERNKK